MGELVRIDPGRGGLPSVHLQGVDLVGAFLAGRRPTTLRAYRADLDDFARFVGATSAAAAVELLVSGTGGQANTIALAYRAHLTGRALAPATVARRLAALRSMVKLARTLGRVAWTLEIEGPRSEVYRDTAGPGRDGWRALLDRAKAEAATPKGLRDLALVRLLHDLALRRAEAVGLDLAHADLEGSAVAVLGKGRGGRVRLTMPEPVRRALADWIGVHPDPRPEAPLFVRLDRAGSGGGRLTGRAVHQVVLALGRRAGLDRPVKPHGLRHQGITRALDVSGGDVRAAQRYSRHRKLDVLLSYDDNRRDLAGELARRVSEE